MHRREKVNPHCFYRNSTAPIMNNVIHKRHTSFTPGPGRYETRYWKICPCPSHKIYKPGLYLLVDREKRHKLRWEEYHKINIKKYCCPDWGHVIGGGYARLFRKVIKRPQVGDITKPTTRRPPQITKWAHALHSISARVKTHRELPERQKEIKYNTHMNVTTRKRMRFNKIAFGSGVRHRFATGRPSRKSTIRGFVSKTSVHTTTKSLKIINFPILDKPFSAIDARYKEVPARFAPPGLTFSKRYGFKFSTLPTAKLLLSDEESSFKQEFPKLYNNPIDPLKYVDNPDQVTKERADEMREFVAQIQCFGGDRNDCRASFSKLSIIRSKVSSMFS